MRWVDVICPIAYNIEMLIVAVRRSTMVFRGLLGIVLSSVAVSCCLADETLYRYEGDVLPYDESAGWEIFNPCEDPCSESLENGRFVLRWAHPADAVNYHLWIARPEDPPPPPMLWVEWRFRSNHPIGPNFFGCDASFVVKDANTFELVYMYGDTVISFSGDDFVTGLDINDFHTYRFESTDGVNYRISVDGQVFIVGFDDSPNESAFLQFRGGGSCEPFVNTVNEWDFVRYGTVSFGERIVASDPRSGVVSAQVHPDLDRFTVTFDSPNYVYVDDISVEVTGGVTPVVLQTRRLDNGSPDRVEIVLDRPIPLAETTRFTFDDGTAVNVVTYTYVAYGVPALSPRGVVVLTLLLVTAGTLILLRRTQRVTG